MSTERPACGLGSLLPMSCRVKAEAFARRLHNRLQNLGNGTADTDETSWLSPQAVTTCQPRLSSSSDSDLYFDFDMSPASPVDEQQHEPESGCVLSSPDSDSSDGPYFDLDAVPQYNRHPVHSCCSSDVPKDKTINELLHFTFSDDESTCDNAPQSPRQTQMQAQQLHMSSNFNSKCHSSRGMQENGERIQDKIPSTSYCIDTHSETGESTENGSTSVNGFHTSDYKPEEEDCTYCSKFSKPNGLVIECPDQCTEAEEGCCLIPTVNETSEELSEEISEITITPAVDLVRQDCKQSMGDLDEDITQAYRESSAPLEENAAKGLQECEPESRTEISLQKAELYAQSSMTESSIPAECHSTDVAAGAGALNHCGARQNGHLAVSDDGNDHSKYMSEQDACSEKLKEENEVIAGSTLLPLILNTADSEYQHKNICVAENGENQNKTVVIVTDEANIHTDDVDKEDQKCPMTKISKEEHLDLSDPSYIPCPVHNTLQVVDKSNSNGFDDDSTPQRLRRSSSLKTGKTPPGTPGRKKIVRFADVFGLDLADVRTFMDEIPRIPSSAYNDLHDADLSLSSSAMPLTGFPNSSNLTLNLSEPNRCLVPLFQQPGGQPDFLDRVRETQVCLENAVVKDPVMFSIAGAVRVRNLDFHKSVYIRYTLDGWSTYADLQATYVPNSCDGFSDKFTFTLYAHTLVVGQRLEFAVRFQCKGSQFWDNNQGSNYAFQCLPPAISTPFLPLASPEERWMSFY